MALSNIHQFTVKYRNRTGDDLNQCLITLCRLLSSFATIDKQTEPIVHALRELFLTLQLSQTERRVPENVATLFITALRDLKSIHPQVFSLAVACLAEVCPSATVRIDVASLELLDVHRIPEFLHLLRQQNLPEEFGHGVCTFLVKSLNDAVSTVAGKKAVLAFLTSQFRSGHDAVMFQDCFDMLCWSVSNWLVNASTFDDFQQENSKRSTKKMALLSVTELDGSTPSELFTVLSLAKSYAEDQQMNILSFSLLYDILQALPFRGAMVEIGAGGSLDMAISTMQGRVRADSVEDVAFEYCLHLLKQAETRPLKSSYDCELQDAVLSEAVRILDLLCVRDPKLVRKAFRGVADLNDRTMRRIHNNMLLLHVFQFMLNHGESAGTELGNMCHYVCCDLVANGGLMDNVFASEFLALLRRNKGKVESHTKVFQRYFPVILKVLAWSPRANMHLFMELMSVLVVPSTCLELFHSLVDLPSVSAALEVTIFGEKSYQASIRQLAADKANDPRLRLYLDFFLRNESGRGVTVENMSEFHRLLSEVTSHPRVIFCSQAVPALLSVFFTVVATAKHVDHKAVVLAVLGRMHLLYGSFTENIQMQQVMGDGVCLLLAKQTSVFVELHTEISDYIIANHFLYPLFLTSLIWCIGEQSRALFKSHTKALGKLYEAVESLTYDIIKTKTSDILQNPHDGIMELFSACLKTMTSLGSQSYDLTRRAVICLNNVVKKTREHPEQQRFPIVDQINSLIKMLALPSVTEIVMNLSISPEPEVLEAIKNLKSVEEERDELILGQSL